MKLIAPLLLAAIVAAAACGADSGAAADSVTVLREGGCRGCRIVVDTLALLGDDNDTLSIDEGATPVTDSRGRFYIIEKGGGSILVYGPDGNVLTRFGRAGSGPGEFRSIAEMHVLPGDTLLVLGGGVLHFISPEYQHIRQVASSRIYESGFFNTMLADGRVVRLSGPNQFVLLDTTGNLTDPVLLGGTDTTACPECGLRTFREGTEPGTLWSAPQNAYRVDQHDLSGKLLRRFEREVTWFPEWAERTPDRQVDILAELQKARSFGVRQTDDGLVWLHVLSVEAFSEMPRIDTANFNNRTASQLYQKVVTTLEAFDPQTGRVVATRELEGLVAPMRGGLVAQMLLNEYGDWMCRVLRMRVDGLPVDGIPRESGKTGPR